MSSTRKTIREAFEDLLAAGVTAAQATYDFPTTDFSGQSPIVSVASSGSMRPRFSLQGASGKVYLDVYVFVRYPEASEAVGAADVEDYLDTIESQIAQVVADNQKTANWDAIDYDGRSDVETIQLDGPAFRRERIPLVFTVFA